jgi:putative pyruvate formate lyase activating enzyme
MGSFVAKNEFANICLALQERGAENINIVTGSHAVPAIVQALECAKMSGLSIPVLWNSSAYETIETLTLLRDAIDIYLPDLKTLDGRLAKQFFGAEDYPRYAVAAIKTMLEFKPHQVIIRHLVLPGHLESTYDVLRWFADNARGRADLSLMTQYTPRPPYPPSAPQRYVNNCEYDTIMSWLAEFEIDDGYYQELETGSEWLPDFTQENPFPSELSIPVWHWREGYSAAPRLD